MRSVLVLATVASAAAVDHGNDHGTSKKTDDGKGPAGAKVEPKYVIITGAPNSGKGTHSKHISDALGIEHFGTSDWFKARWSTIPEADAAIKSGGMVPAEYVNPPLFEELRKDRFAPGVLLDGFPRSLEQANALDSFLGQEKHSKINLVVSLKVKLETLIKRAVSRWVATNGDSYSRNEGQTTPLSLRPHIKKCQAEAEKIKKESYKDDPLPGDYKEGEKKPKGWKSAIDKYYEAIDEVYRPYMFHDETVSGKKVAGTKEKLTRRGDDTVGTVEKRYNGYIKETQPILEHYRKKNAALVVEIDGEAGFEKVREAIKAAVATRFNADGSIIDLPAKPDTPPGPQKGFLSSNPSSGKQKENSSSSSRFSMVVAAFVTALALFF